MPNNTRDNEKNTLIALTASISSFALISIYEYQFHSLGTKRCHNPKPIEEILPIITNEFASLFKSFLLSSDTH
jgi:hypothetical protein